MAGPASWKVECGEKLRAGGRTHATSAWRACFNVDQRVLQFVATIDSYMPSQMLNWYSNCAPMNRDTGVG